MTPTDVHCTVMHMITEHTPAQAADIAKVSRSTISRAIKNGKLKARKSNHGWMILDEALTAWMGGVQRTGAAHVRVQPDSGRVAILEVENRMLKERIDELRIDRDSWKDQASRRWWDFLRSK